MIAKIHGGEICYTLITSMTSEDRLGYIRYFYDSGQDNYFYFHFERFRLLFLPFITLDLGNQNWYQIEHMLLHLFSYNNNNNNDNNNNNNCLGTLLTKWQYLFMCSRRRVGDFTMLAESL